MNKNFLFVLISVMSLSIIACRSKDPETLRQETTPLQLAADEVGFWERLVEIECRKGVASPERSALRADKFILELRKRNGRD
ncbi:hypothetical protein AGMMS50268_18170 [Spirochaetia bacterium]|nr:hypothetical protein AGMMS50268_18170 [Spirochaetia bacterium]